MFFIGFSGSPNLCNIKGFMVSTTLNIFNIFHIKFRSRKHKFYVMLKHISHNIFNFMFFMLSFLNSGLIHVEYKIITKYFISFISENASYKVMIF